MTWLRKIFKNNKGFSLVELVISIAIMSIITAGIGAAMVSATRNYGRGTTEVDLQTNAQNITNIITNLIVDSANAANADDGSSVDTGSTSLYVTSISGRCYVISYIGNVNSNGTGNLYYAEADSFAGCTDYSILSENVVGFTADTHTYPNDYTVHITIELSYPSESRSYASSFSVTSRNAAGAGSYINNLDDATIVGASLVIIEPNESYTNKASLSLDCSVNTSGSVTDTSFSYYVLENKEDAISDALDYAHCGLEVTHDVANGKLNLTANQYISPNSSGCLYIKVITNATDASGNAYDSKFITVYVRKVAVATITKDKTASTDSTNQAGSIHVITGNLSIYNPGRKYAIDSDFDYNDPTSSVYDVIWTVSCKGKNGNNVAYYLDSVKLENGTDILSQILSTDGYKGTSGEKFTVKLKNQLPKGEVITFTMTPVHNQGLCSYGGTTYVTNKASLAAYNGGTAVAKTYPCNPAYYKISAGFFDEISDYQRGTVLNKTGFGNCTGSGIYYEMFKDKHDEYKALLAADPTGTDSYGNTYAEVCDWLDKFSQNQISFTVSYFYRIKDYTLDLDGGSLSAAGWSQYRIMGTGTNFDFNKAANPSLSSATDLGFTTDISSGNAIGGTLTTGMTNRLNGDTYQSVEFVVVIYDTSTKQILWPNYEALREYGFGEYDKHCGVGYTFSKIAASITDDYSTYATCFDVVPASITYSANSTVGTPSGNTVGSTSNPVVLGDGITTNFDYDQTNWVGLDYKEYQNIFSGILMKYDGSGWQQVGVFGLGDGLSQEIQCEGGFKVRTVNTSFVIDTQNGGTCTDTQSTYRVVPICYKFKLGYIRDEDQIFSNKTYWDTDHVYTYMMAKGSLADDPLASTITFKRYGNPKTISLVLNDSTDYRATCDSKSVIYIEKKGFTDLLPTPSRPGYEFIGWFTAVEGGTQVTDYTTSLTVDKLYAQWDDIIGLNYKLKLLSSGYNGWATVYSYRLYNYSNSSLNLVAKFTVENGSVANSATTYGISYSSDSTLWKYSTTLAGNSYVDLNIYLTSGKVEDYDCVDKP